MYVTRRIPAHFSSPTFLPASCANYGRLRCGNLFKSCSSICDLKRLHAYLLTQGLASSLDLATKLVSLASALSPTMEYARKLFELMADRDSFLWNTLIRGYATIGPCEEVPGLYKEMHLAGFSPDYFTFPFVVRSCAVVSAIREGKQVHCSIVKNGLDSNIFAQGSLITLYSQSGEISDAELVFGEMDERSVVSWTAMVAGYAQNCWFRKAVVAFRQMIASGMQPNEVTMVSVLPACNEFMYLSLGRAIHGFVIKSGLEFYLSLANALMTMYGKCGAMEAAKSLFDSMSARSLVSWNTMIATYEQNGDGAKAIKLFRRMNVQKLMFDGVTLLSAISACARLGNLDAGRWVHELAVSRGLETDVRVGNALLDMYAKCGNVDSAREIFGKLPPSKGVVSWSTMIGAYASHGHAKEALELFDRMKDGRITPNSFTFASVLAACSHSGLVDEGLFHFNSMKKDYGINPTVEHCACLVDLLGRAGKIIDAYEFIKRMEVRPDRAVWGALLGACRIHRNTEIAELVVKDLFQLDPQNVTFYVIMSNLYAETGRWEDAALMRRKVKDHELRKAPGCSLVGTNKTTFNISSIRCSRENNCKIILDAERFIMKDEDSGMILLKEHSPGGLKYLEDKGPTSPAAFLG